MNMVSKIAFCNMKYHRSKNILIGIAIFLTALLLFLIPTIGKNMIDGQMAVVNEIYPTWYALYRDVNSSMVEKLSAHHDISVYGLRSDAGYMALENASVSMIYLDEEGADLYQIKLSEGRLPEKENEFVVSPGILKELGQDGRLGDTIAVPYQIFRDGGLDYTEEKTFTICGFLPDGEDTNEEKIYSALISKAFLEEEVPAEQIIYRFLFQLNGKENSMTNELKNSINNIASQFGIPDKNVRINDEYLAANYNDPSTLPVLAAIMLVIVVAGMITIYSIYYVSMAERVQEFGRLKAIGATRRQLKQIVLREGFCVALFAVPLGLLAGTVLSRLVFTMLLSLYQHENIMMSTMNQMLLEHKIPLYYWWIYLLVVAVTFVTVYLSLQKPMRVAANVSEVEAMRFQGGNQTKKNKKKKSCQDINIGRLTRIFLQGNQKKSVITICSMGATGIFLMVVATVLSCANPVESANNSILGQYDVRVMTEFQNKEHPEREWTNIQKNNPITEELIDKLQALDGVEDVDCFSKLYATSKIFGDDDIQSINGVPEKYAKMLEDGIIEGKVTYEELKSGDKVILDKNMLYWYPDLAVGDKLTLSISEGDERIQKEVEIAAIGDYQISFNGYGYMHMAKEAVDAISQYNNSKVLHIFARDNYDAALEQSIKEIMTSTSDLLEMESWQEHYEEWKAALTLTSGGCYAFLAILGMICIMNMVNTMINSVHVRKREIGMMQAIGMSDQQLTQMLQLEGLFYTIGTLILSVGVGSALGYPVFLWAKWNGMFNISRYHYPVVAAIVVTVVLLTIQMLLAIILGKSVKKESIIERIRISE